MKPQALDNKNAETPGPPGRERSNQISEFWVQKGKRKKKGEKKKKRPEAFYVYKIIYVTQVNLWSRPSVWCLIYTCIFQYLLLCSLL